MFQRERAAEAPQHRMRRVGPVALGERLGISGEQEQLRLVRRRRKAVDKPPRRVEQPVALPGVQAGRAEPRGRTSRCRHRRRRRRAASSSSGANTVTRESPPTARRTSAPSSAVATTSHEPRPRCSALRQSVNRPRQLVSPTPPGSAASAADAEFVHVHQRRLRLIAGRCRPSGWCGATASG